jgi:protein TonB
MSRSSLIGPTVFFVCSLGLHAAALALLNRPPNPLPSVGTVAMSLEIVIGTDTPAGLEKDRAESESMVTSTASIPDTSSSPTPLQITREETAPQEPQASVKEQTSDTISVTVKTVGPPMAIESESKTSIPAEPVPASSGESPEFAVRSEPSQVPVSPSARKEPDREQVRPERGKRAVEHAVKPQQRESKTQSGSTRQVGKETRTASVAATASSGIGRGRSDAEHNCGGLVTAHVRRYQQWDSQERSDHGNTKVTFTLDGAGRLISTHLASSSGVASIDQESLAMVRRAAPFSLPSDCLGVTYTVPLSFNLR